jgi:PAS domain S-box-containing protein
MPGQLQLLLLEDEPADAALILTTVRKAGLECEAHRVDSEDSFRAALEAGRFDLILSDHTLPGFGGPAALEIAREQAPEVPFVFVSGAIGEEVAIELIKKGATDYVLKDRLARLVPAIERALAERDLRQARQEAEKSLAEAVTFFRNMFDQLVIGVTIINLEGRIVKANPAAEKILGYSEEELRRMEDIAELVAPEDLAAHAVEFAEVMSGNRPWLQLERRILRPNGEVRIVRAVTSLIRDGLGKMQFSMSLFEDITEHRELEQEFQRTLHLQRESDAASRAKSVFLANVSHEIRTPMNAILGYSQLLQRDPNLSPAAKENLQIISQSGEHLLAIIDGVLDMSKIEAGRMELQPTTFHPRETLRKIGSMLRLRAQNKSLEFEVELEGEPAPHIEADEGKLRQILINLAVNAIKFTERGKVQLRVALRETEQGCRLRAEVKDTGPGISELEQEHLFQAFSQTSSGRSGKGGTGLGLAISRQYAQLMGGNLTLRSRAGEGACFQLDIPVRIGEPLSTVRQSAQRRVTGLRPGSGVPRILLADDQFENRDWLAKLLRSAGFQVVEAIDGESAVREWRQHAPHLIFMDAQMPGMDGIEAMRTIRARPEGAGTVIIVLTAGVLEEQRRMAEENGADDFLGKPCKEADLLEMIRIHLQVEYEYEYEDAEASREPVRPDVEAFRQLRMEWADKEFSGKLRDAVAGGDIGLVRALIGQLRSGGCVEAAETLQWLAERYEYDELLRILED